MVETFSYKFCYGVILISQSEIKILDLLFVKLCHIFGADSFDPYLYSSISIYIFVIINIHDLIIQSQFNNEEHF
jgi:hypothetical protein